MYVHTYIGRQERESKGVSICVEVSVRDGEREFLEEEGE
jgi:hypothetical protein